MLTVQSFIEQAEALHKAGVVEIEFSGQAERPLVKHVKLNQEQTQFYEGTAYISELVDRILDKLSEEERDLILSGLEEELITRAKTLAEKSYGPIY